MSGFDADADRLAGQAGEFAGLADRAGAIHRDLVGRLEALGRCWGADEVGQSFAAGHTGPAEQTLSRVGSLPGRIGTVGTNFADTATAYRRTDEAGASTVSAADPTADV